MGSFIRGLLLGGFGTVLVGGSVAVSEVLGDAPMFTAQAIRYLTAAVLLVHQRTLPFRKARAAPAGA